MEWTNAHERLPRARQLHVRRDNILDIQALLNLRDSVGCHYLDSTLLTECPGLTVGASEETGTRGGRWSRSRGLKLRDVRELLATSEASTRWDKASENDVLFQTAQAVNASAQCGANEDFRRLLK